MRGSLQILDMTLTKKIIALVAARKQAGFCGNMDWQDNFGCGDKRHHLQHHRNDPG